MEARFAAVCAALWLGLGGVAGAACGQEADEAPLPGAELRAGLADLDAGRAREAAERFAAVASTAPEVADHAGELRIEALLRAGDAAAVLAEAAAFRARFDSAWLVARVFGHEGDAYVSLGQEERARAAYLEAMRREPESAATRLAQIAASEERSGDAAAATARWLEVWTRHATTPEAATADAALARLAVARTPAAWSERCFRLSEALHNEAALASCDAALAATPGELRLLRERADVLFRLRRYADAVAAFGALGDGADASFWKARSLARSGRIDDSLAAFARLADGPDRALAARARFLSATLLEDTDLAAAEAAYRRVAETAPAADQRSAARWRIAWLAWRRGDVAAAAESLETYAAGAPDPAERVRGRYWHGRALVRLGRADGGERLARLAREEPLSYYGWRAASAAAPPVAAPLDVAAAPPPVIAAPAPLEGSFANALPDAALRRIQILLEAGLDERAAREIRAAGDAANGPGARLVLAQLLVEAERFDLAQRLVISGVSADFAQHPPPGREAAWWLAWPTAFDADVRRAARAHGVEPALVFAIMREESGYQVDALSVVGARGLTQIMPETGRRLAADLGAASFDPAELFSAPRNLELGAFYLAQLVARFDGRYSAAIASYNAGPEAVARWIAADGAREDDEWVESIPYDQTRSYVKRVLRSVHVYRTLYGS